MEAIFGKILNMSLSAAVVIAAVLPVRALLSRAPKKWSYLLWAVVGFRLCCPVSLRSAFSLFALRPARAASPSPAAELLLPQGAAIAPMTPPPAVSPALPAVGTVGQGVETAASAAPALSLTAVAAAVWCLGMLVMLACAAVSYVRLRRTLTDAVLLHGNVWETDRIHSPFILGLIRPRIYLPAGLGGSALRYVMEHEEHHLRRGDHFVKAFAFALLTVHWFNPLVWLAFHLMGKDQEMSCDEKVLGGAENIRKAYSDTLLSFAANRHFPAPSPLAFGETGVKTRIKNALRWKRPKLWATLLAAILCLAVTAACALDPKQETSESEPGLTVSIPEQYAAALDVESDTESVAIYEKASREAFRADHPEGFDGQDPDTAGMGWLGTLKCVNEADAKEALELTEIGGVRYVAKDDQGNWYLFSYPTDVRLYRGENYENLSDADVTRWTELTDWAQTIPDTFVSEHPELTAVTNDGARELLKAAETAESAAAERLFTLFSNSISGAFPDRVAFTVPAEGGGTWDVRVVGSAVTHTGRVVPLSYFDGVDTWTPGMGYTFDFVDIEGLRELTMRLRLTDGDGVTRERSIDLMERLGIPVYEPPAPDTATIRAVADSLFGTYGSPGAPVTVTITDRDAGRTDTFAWQEGEASAVYGTLGYQLENGFRWERYTLTEDLDSRSRGPYVLRIENAGGDNLTVYSGAPYLTVNGATFVSTGGESPYDLLLGRVAWPAYFASDRSAVTAPGSVTDYGEAARLIAEAYLARLLDRPGWVSGRAQDGYVESAEVFDAYYGDELPNFCFNMRLRLKIDEPNTLYWQAGAGLSAPDARGYYGWGAEVVVMKTDDGTWHFWDAGTGGYSVYLPGYANGFDYMETCSASELLDLYFKTGGMTREWRVLLALGENHTADEIKTAMAALTDAQRAELLAGMARFNAEYRTADGDDWPPTFDLDQYR